MPSARAPRWRGPLLLGAFALTAPLSWGCGALDDLLSGGDGGGGGSGPATLALELQPCRSEPGLYDVSGAYIFAFETISQVSGGPLSGSQKEVITRYGALQLCQRGPQVEAQLRTCALHHGRLEDRSGSCAAQVPDVALLNALPVAHSVGEISLDGAFATIRLPWAESWGLEPGARLPEEPHGAAPLSADTPGLLDMDGDGLPGVTVRGDGPVPTTSWVARTTQASIFAQSEDGEVFIGITESQTDEAVLGGPASRWLRGIQRKSLPGSFMMVRADGALGGLQLVRAGQISCAAVIAQAGESLPDPQEESCRP